MRNRKILKSEAKILWKDQIWGQPKIWGQAKFEAISKSRPGQWDQAGQARF